MRKTKTRRDKEVYEKYWNFTAGFTDIHDKYFITTLTIIRNYIDSHKEELNAAKVGTEEFSKLYTQLQNLIIEYHGYDSESSGTTVRKIINTYVKIGFIQPGLRGYDGRVNQFLLADDEKTRERIFTTIFYDKSSISSSVTKDNTDLNHVKFLLNTIAHLPEGRHFSEDDLTGIMNVDIRHYSKGFLNDEELDKAFRYATINNFKERKYNQISHLLSYLKKCIDIQYDPVKKELYILDDPDVKVDTRDISYSRDPYRHYIYRNELKAESLRVYGKVVCYASKREQKGLIASHIKPSETCIKEGKSNQAYDYHNGILLSPEIDAYFDKSNISFNDDGSMEIGREVPVDMKNLFLQYSLDEPILVPERIEYLHHRQELYKLQHS
jgi:hypothetical protein